MMKAHIVIHIQKSCILTTETQANITHSTITMLGNDDFCNTFRVVAMLILINLIIFGTMDEAHHVSVLLNGT